MPQPPSGKDLSSDKKAPGLLRRHLRLIAGGTAATLAAATVGTIAVFGTATGDVPLTQDEAAIAQSLFGPDFRTDNIRKQYVRSWVGGVIQYPGAMVPLSQRHIYFFKPEMRKPDLTISSGDDFNLYMHEMTHIWQHRGNWAPLCKTYDYTLTARSRFTDFCNEQQASMVGDYAEFFLNPTSPNALRLLGDNTSRREGNENLMRVIEGQFPHARQARLKIEAQNRAVYRCIVRFNVTFNTASGKPTDADQVVITGCFTDPAQQPPPPSAVEETAPPETAVDAAVEAAQRLFPFSPRAPS